MTAATRSAATRSAATIAEALHLAADKYLAANYNQFATYPFMCNYSCGAVTYACYELGINLGGVFVGLKNMGCDITSSTLFDDYHDSWGGTTEEVQGMRYMWLKWAALMAEEQGV